MAVIIDHIGKTVSVRCLPSHRNGKADTMSALGAGNRACRSETAKDFFEMQEKLLRV